MYLTCITSSSITLTQTLGFTLSTIDLHTNRIYVILMYDTQEYLVYLRDLGIRTQHTLQDYSFFILYVYYYTPYCEENDLER
jgi:hypothetical protein